uniref:Uncharacterized protein n=1 Tax=Salix viminalis TaxID=40686 RepID=A0A6N2MSA8_SALVM
MLICYQHLRCKWRADSQEKARVDWMKVKILATGFACSSLALSLNIFKEDNHTKPSRPARASSGINIPCKLSVTVHYTTILKYAVIYMGVESTDKIENRSAGGIAPAC